MTSYRAFYVAQSYCAIKRTMNIQLIRTSHYSLLFLLSDLISTPVDSTFSPSTPASFPLLPISHLVSLSNCTTLASSNSPCNHSSPALLTQYHPPFIYLDPLGHSQYLSKFASKEHFFCTLNPSVNPGDPTMALSTLLLWERRFPIPKTMALFVLSISCLAASNSHKPGI